MKVVQWKLILTTALAVGIPCFVLGDNSGPPKASPAPGDVQGEGNDAAAPAADREPGENGPRGPREWMRRPHGPKLEKAAFLGIATSPVSEEMRAQLKLPEGTALLIDRVEDDSPAAKAGVKKFDVLTKLDDQLIINPEQLAVLVRMHKANDEVKLGIIHEAAAATVSATLVEKDLPPLPHGRPPGSGGPGGEGPAIGPMPGFMHGMHRGMGMGGWMGMHPGMGDHDGMHGGMGGPERMQGEMGGPGRMPGGWGMRGPRGEFGMRRGPQDDQTGGPQGEDNRGGPDGPEDQGPPRHHGFHGGGPGPDGGPPTSQPAPGGQQP